jgi:cytochrome c nitrite reductase small subunit
MASHTHAAALAIGTVALLFLLALIIFGPIPDSPRRHWLLLFGIVILPGLALVLGTGATMDDAKAPEFCGSCHVMGPFIKDLRNPDSTTLAAVHYQNRYILQDQCYTCHSDYGPFGPMKAKMAGARHLWHYETGHYTLPIKIIAPYNFANCLHCHGEAKVFREKHEALKEQIDSGEIVCLDCHGPAHPPREERAS